MESNRRGRGRGRNRGFRDRGGRRGDFSHSVEVRKPIFKTVEEICPEMGGINIKLKVITLGSNNNREVLMGDNTGSVIVFVNDNSLLQQLRDDTSVYVRNGFVEMKNDAFIRLKTNEWGKIEVAQENFDFIVKKGNNISEVEYTIE
ncbi:hypothetical protein SteCoe_16576 [Stentor coeruleus]|uniref:Single-stranded DNA binding protein Ssb-like OB fold domain-containing protein n=1 Tax=Stentor coeruleus TaxID=5963 RepID=A0A1R2C0V9_9CILI|nr:hypothetical protein SteCoe_16576 [Stentor coeruleus]